METFAHDGRQVLVLSSDAVFRRAAVRAMRQSGMGVLGCRSVDEAQRRAARVDAPLLVLAEEPATLAGMCSGLRRSSPHAGIVAVAHYVGPAQRIAVMEQGADLCMAGDLQVGELVAALHALDRRLSGRPLATRAVRLVWRLVDKSWSLQSPDGVRLPLTAGERDFMAALLAAPDARLDRRVYVAARGAASTRRLDMLVSRLRGKARRQGLALPLRTVAGWGYAFAGEL